MNEETKEKLKNLKEKLNQITQEDAAVAFSGGTDSALLLKAAADEAAKNGTTVHAITADTELMPSVKNVETAEDKAGQDICMYEKSEKMAQSGGIHYHVLKLSVIENAGIKNNPPNRCYLCKQYLFSEIKKEAEKHGAKILLDGTNFDDLNVYRPGLRAAKELGVISPLADCLLTKNEVREISEHYGLETSKKPSSPCMATRFSYGTGLDASDMARLFSQEEVLRRMGFYNVRIRIHEDFIRIETDTEALPRVMENREKILDILKEWDKPYVTLDLDGFRSGSMDVVLHHE